VQEDDMAFVFTSQIVSQYRSLGELEGSTELESDLSSCCDMVNNVTRRAIIVTGDKICARELCDGSLYAGRIFPGLFSKHMSYQLFAHYYFSEPREEFYLFLFFSSM